MPQRELLRWGLDLQIRAALLPVTAAVHADPVRVCPLPSSFDAISLRACYARDVPHDPVRAAQAGGHALIFNPPEGFFSTDEVVVERLLVQSDGIEMRLRVTRVESQDGEPAPRELFVVVPLNPTLSGFAELALSFAGEERGFDGTIHALDAPVAARIAMRLSGA